jgi:hypothetical protein
MRFRTLALLGATLFAPVTVAVADDDDDYRWGRDRRDRGVWRDDDGWRNNRRDNGRWRNSGRSPISSAIRDLQQMSYSNRYISGHDRNHFDRALYHLSRFEDRWQSGRFEKDRLDDAIDHMKDLAGANRLNSRDRQRISYHINEIRAFRSSGGAYYGRNGGYPDYRRWP